MTSTIDQALQRLRESTTAVWLVQCNPRLTHILGSSRTALPDAWCVKRHTSEICRGNRIVLWLSGADAGAYALGEVTADARPLGPSDAGDARSTPVIKVSVDLFVDLFERPVKRAVLKMDQRFAVESIMRQPFAANPHRLSPPAFDAILERVTRPG